MIGRVAACCARLARAEQGSTLVEFALILTPLCVLLIGGMDLAYTSYVRTLMQGALDEAARKATVESPATGRRSRPGGTG